MGDGPTGQCAFLHCCNLLPLPNRHQRIERTLFVIQAAERLICKHPPGEKKQNSTVESQWHVQETFCDKLRVERTALSVTSPP